MTLLLLLILHLHLHVLSHWCSQNKMSVNISKAKVVHFRKKNKALTDFEFKLGDSILEICHKYKYLGVILNEFVDFTEITNVLSESAGRAFSMLVSNLYKKVDVTWSTYSKMYKSKLVPIMDYNVLLFGGLSYTQNLILFIIGLLSFSKKSINIHQNQLFMEIWAGTLF